jgi:gluconate 2-dehydrogenase gamma chain
MDETEGGPPPARPISRRELLKRAGVAGAVATVPAGVAVNEAPAAELEQLEYFTVEEAGIIDAVVERLIPSDANGPGAKEARVARYIDRALGGELSIFRDVYGAGLEQLEAFSRGNYGAGFTSLTPEQQDAVLREMERAGQPAPPTGSDVREGAPPPTRTRFQPSAAAFFEVIREHTLQGMFGDPYHGGNAKYIGWDLIGFSGIKLFYSAREQRLDVQIKPAHKSTTAFKIFGTAARNGTAPRNRG